MDNLLPSSDVIITRSSKGIFKRSAAKVLIESRIVHFNASDERVFTLRPGVVTLLVNNRKFLRFQLDANQTKEFIFREGISDWRFLLKYGVLLFIIACLVYAVTRGWSNGDSFGGLLIPLLLLAWTIKEARYDYFYLEEV